MSVIPWKFDMLLIKFAVLHSGEKYINDNSWIQV